MRIALCTFALALLTAGAASAAAQTSPEQPSSGGGLHVSNGGSVGYVGGSGSISGTVRGPGSSAPRKPVVTQPAPKVPSALIGGVVRPGDAGIDRRQSVENARAASALTGPMIAAGMVILACAILFVRRRPTSG